MRAGALALIACLLGGAADPDALQRDVCTYDSFGPKLTGGPGNRMTVRWMATRLESLGFEVTKPAFSQPAFHVRRAELAVDGRRIAGFPLFPPESTPAQGVSGPLVTWDGRSVDARLAGAVALLLLPDQRHSSTALSFKGLDPQVAARAGALALVVVTRNPSGDLIALNADSPEFRPTIPTLLVAGREGTSLLAASARSAAARVTLRANRTPARPRNIIALRRRGPRWVVISTPVSGWFSAAAERGPGVAILLALAAEARRLAPCDSVALVATSGHESGYGGIEALLESEALPRPEQTRLWVHLGAGLAAWGDEARTRAESVRFLLTTQPAEDRARRAFAGLAGYERPVVVDGRTAVGEAEAIIRHGYPAVVAGVSAHLYHHSPRDHAERTSGQLLAPIADAFSRLIEFDANRTCELLDPS